MISSSGKEYSLPGWNDEKGDTLSRFLRFRYFNAGLAAGTSLSVAVTPAPFNFGNRSIFIESIGLDAFLSDSLGNAKTISDIRYDLVPSGDGGTTFNSGASPNITFDANAQAWNQLGPSGNPQNKLIACDVGVEVSPGISFIVGFTMSTAIALNDVLVVTQWIKYR